MSRGIKHAKARTQISSPTQQHNSEQNRILSLRRHLLQLHSRLMQDFHIARIESISTMVIFVQPSVDSKARALFASLPIRRRSVIVVRPGSNSTISQAHQNETGAKTPSAPAHPAMDAVLNTVELLEQVLLRLPMKTLLLSQRVSPKWNNIIFESKLLQKKLFFQPAMREDLPSLHIVEEDFFWDVDKADAVRTHNVWDTGENVLVHNPLLLRQHSKDHTSGIGLRLLQMAQHGTGNKPEAYWTQKMTTDPLAKSTRVPGTRSFERMLPVQPVNLTVKLEIGGGYYYFHSSFKLQEILVAAERFVFKRPERWSGNRTRKNLLPVVLFSRDNKSNTADVTVIGRPVGVDDVKALGYEIVGKDGGRLVKRSE